MKNAYQNCNIFLKITLYKAWDKKKKESLSYYTFQQNC